MCSSICVCGSRIIYTYIYKLHLTLKATTASWFRMMCLHDFDCVCTVGTDDIFHSVIHRGTPNISDWSGRRPKCINQINLEMSAYISILHEHENRSLKRIGAKFRISYMCYLYYIYFMHCVSYRCRLDSAGIAGQTRWYLNNKS